MPWIRRKARAIARRRRGIPALICRRLSAALLKCKVTKAAECDDTNRRQRSAGVEGDWGGGRAARENRAKYFNKAVRDYCALPADRATCRKTIRAEPNELNTSQLDAIIWPRWKCNLPAHYGGIMRARGGRGRGCIWRRTPNVARNSRFISRSPGPVARARVRVIPRVFYDLAISPCCTDFINSSSYLPYPTIPFTLSLSIPPLSHPPSFSSRFSFIRYSSYAHEFHE